MVSSTCAQARAHMHTRTHARMLFKDGATRTECSIWILKAPCSQQIKLQAQQDQGLSFTVETKTKLSNAIICFLTGQWATLHGFLTATFLTTMLCPIKENTWQDNESNGSWFPVLPNVREKKLPNSMITQWEGIYFLYFLLIGKNPRQEKQQTNKIPEQLQTNKQPSNNTNLDLNPKLPGKAFPDRHSVSDTTVNTNQFIIWNGQVVLFYFPIALFSQFLAPLSSTYSL